MNSKHIKLSLECNSLDQSQAKKKELIKKEIIVLEKWQAIYNSQLDILRTKELLKLREVINQSKDEITSHQIEICKDFDFINSQIEDYEARMDLQLYFLGLKIDKSKSIENKEVSSYRQYTVSEYDIYNLGLGNCKSYEEFDDAFETVYNN